jgi:hypothetical protein
MADACFIRFLGNTLKEGSISLGMNELKIKETCGQENLLQVKFAHNSCNLSRTSYHEPELNCFAIT